jgi:hypothetical protein
MNLTRIAAAAVLTLATAAPVFADPAARSVSAQNRLQKEQAYRHGYGTGFWPADAAVGIVGGAIGTAGAIAAAPFGAGPYAYYHGPYIAGRGNYGLVCEPRAHGFEAKMA